MHAWTCPPSEPAAEAALAATLDAPPVLARVLRARGLAAPEAARAFLHPSLDALPDPATLPDMDAAVQRLRRALRDHERILVHGDYDADGTAGAALLALVLEALGAEVEAVVPDRNTHGYGLAPALCAAAATRGARLVVTADLGSADPDAVDAVRALGLDVIVTDHHDMPRGVPTATAVVNPRRTGGPPLCGAGVALMLALALVRDAAPAARAHTARAVREALELAALATVADMAPLAGPNRILVALGCRLLAAPQNPGLAALRTLSGIDDGVPSPEALAMRLIPRLNAAGRVGDASQALALLLARDAAAVAPLLAACDAANRRRQSVQRKVLRAARAMVAAAGPAHAYAVAGEGWHPGVLGIVAGALARETGRPSAVIGLADARGVGSSRCGPGRSLLPALAASADLLRAWGGHPRAAGFSLDRANVEPFRTRFVSAFAGDGPAPAPVPPPTPDVLAALAECTPAAAEALERLAPFGEGNARPGLGLASVRLTGTVQDAGGGRPSRVVVRRDGVALTLAAPPDVAAILATGTPCDVLVRPRTRAPHYEAVHAAPSTPA